MAITPARDENSRERCAPLTDTPLSDIDAERLARIYGALADPVRLKLLSLIAASGELCSCDFLEPLAKSQPTISHHTRILAEAGLIAGDKRGRWVYWSVQNEQANFVRHSLGS
jgi:ArsR family transcriptional regulator